MMVWKWYDCMTSVWWCDSFVCECCECIQIEEIAKKCKTKNRLKEPQKISLTFKFFCNISPNTATRGFPEDLWRLEKTSSVVIWFAFVYPCVSTEDPEEQVLYIITSKKYTILKRSSESSGTSRTYTQLNQNTGEDFLEKVFRFYASVFRVFRNTSSK